MKLRLLATISALVAIPAFAYAQQGGLQPNVPKPTKADAQNVVQIITSDKVKTQAYCDLAKLFDQIQVVKEKNDSNTIQAVGKQLLPLVDKLGPEYVKVIEGMDQVDLTSNEGEELLSILSEHVSRKSQDGDQRPSCSPKTTGSDVGRSRRGSRLSEEVPLPYNKPFPLLRS